MLYQLSYAHHKLKCGMARLRGLEPLTHGLEVRCSIRLSYRRKSIEKSEYVWSGREDLNLRPPAPKAGALPDCATPRRSSPLVSLPKNSRPEAESEYRFRCAEVSMPVRERLGVES